MLVRISICLTMLSLFITIQTLIQILPLSSLFDKLAINSIYNDINNFKYVCTTFLGFKQSYGLSLAAYGVVMNCSQPSSSKGSVYDYTVMDIMNELNISLFVFTNRVLVITNTASFSDLTAPYYLGLNAKQI